jgi:hypothetical protein
MNKIIITILALATIVLADKPLCTEVDNTDEFVEFSCTGGDITSANLLVAKDLSYIVYEGDSTNGSHFKKEDFRLPNRTEKGITHSRHFSIDKYGVQSVDNEYDHWYSMESIYNLYKVVYFVFK